MPKLLIIILIVVAAGALLFFVFNDRGLSDQELIDLGAEELIGSDQQTEDLKTQDDSDSLAGIEEDILDTDLEDLDRELSDIEKELQGL